MIGIVNYGAGNIFSLGSALKRLHIPFALIEGPETFDQYDKYLVPGVGHAGKAMTQLEKTGLVPLIKATKKPLLGICLGMQLLTERSEEAPTDLLSLIPIQTRLLAHDQSLKVPHMGWNTVAFKKNDELFVNILPESHFYFVHSFYIENNPNFTTGTTFYGKVFSSSIRNNNFWGVQFHPEKSGKEGEQLLTNFYHL